MNSIEYRVQSGETLSSIARRHGVTVDAIARLNGLSDVNHIWAGQVLRIPKESPRSQSTPSTPAQPATYRVRAGDTLSTIAERHNVTVQALTQANSLPNPNLIPVGLVLKLPAASPATPQTQTQGSTSTGTKSSVAQTATQSLLPPQKKTVPLQTGQTPGVVPDEVIRDLELREGKMEDNQKVYIDSRGFPTAGMGHKLTSSELARYKKGDRVPMEVLKSWAKADSQKAYDAAVAQATQAGVTDQAFINALTAVNFQLGTAWYTEHKKTWAFIQAHKWEEAAVEAADSAWNSQTPVRVQDFQAALRAMKGSKGAASKGATSQKTEQAPDLRAIARNVHDAMAGLGTNEDKVYDNLARLKHDKALIDQFKALYQTLYRVDILEALQSEFSNSLMSGNELDHALSYLEARGTQQPKGDKGGKETKDGKDKKGDSSTPTAGKKEKSGKKWVQYFPTSTSTDDLIEPFKSNVNKFIAALKEAGATVIISATYRPPERAYLMHWSYKLVHDQIDPKTIPVRAGVNIDWDHGTLKASVEAAREMTTGYAVNTAKNVAPSLTSNHTAKNAIDMSISWSGELSIKNADGKTVTISSKPRNGTNKDLIAVGATYKVIHFNPPASDPPHWSPTGR